MNRSSAGKNGDSKSRMNHETPLWVRESQAIFFITICCKTRGANQLAQEPVGTALIESVDFRNEAGIWWCSSFVVMPDHVHALIQFSETLPMIRAIRTWKSWTAKQHGVAWQSQWFEHRLRDTGSWREKSAYIMNNPVRAGLVEDSKDWPWFYTSER